MAISDMMGVLANTTVVIIWQYVSVSKQPALHFQVPPWSRSVVGKLRLASHILLFGPLSVTLPQNTTAWASLF